MASADVRTDEDRIQEVLIIEGQNRQYEDTDFLGVKQSLYADEASLPAYDQGISYIVWCRPTQIYKSPSYFSELAPDYPYCVTQGTLPDETFIGVLMAVATFLRHDLLQNVFSSRPEDFLKFGVYTCRFYVEGSWVDVITDTNIPCLRDPETGEFTPAYSTSSNENELWICLAEKAYAKAVGTYEALQKAQAREILMHLTGGSVQQLYFNDDNAFPVENTACPKLWGLLNRSIRNDTMILVEPCAAETDGASEGKDSENATGSMGTGLVSEDNAFLPGRLYSVLDTRIIDGCEVVLLHDPWTQPGEQSWFGDWSVGSSRWDANNGEYQEEVENDPKIPWKRDSPSGYFWMPLSAFRKHFNSAHLCKLFPEDDFTFFCMPGDWHRAEAGGPVHSVRDKMLVKRDAHDSQREAIHQNSAAIVVDGDAHWFNNPQYQMTTTNTDLRRPTTVYISLVPISTDIGDHGHGILPTFTVTSMPKAPETSTRVWDIGNCDVVTTDKVDGNGRAKGQEVSVWALKLDADKVYHILPSTMRRGQEGSFIVRLYSNDPDIVVEALEKCITQTFCGEWRRVGDLDSTGGPPYISQDKSGPTGAVIDPLAPPPVDASPNSTVLVENSKWCQNPQYHLEIIDPYAKDDIHLKVIVRRTDSGAQAAGRRNQQSMIGNIAEIKAEMTVGMTIAKAIALEDLTPTKQVKKGPRQNALGQFIAAKPSSLKKRPGAVEENLNLSSSSESKTIMRKASLSSPVCYSVKSSFSHKSESVIYYPRLPRSWVGNGLIIIPSLSEKGVKGSYELEINCSEPVRVRQLPDAVARTIAGEWRDNECGGNHLGPSWKRNPKYALKFRNINKGNAPARMRFTLFKHGEKWKSMSKKDTVGCMIGFYIFILDKTDGGAGDLRLLYETAFVPDDNVSTGPDFTLEPLGDKEEYIIMPTTFHEDKKGAFVLSITSDYEFTCTKEKS
eukprot:GSChrysophyteH1.ASY1.ANO1.1422.1 assembled CDS